MFNLQDGKAAAAPAPPVCQSQPELHTCDPESDKKMKNIKKVTLVERTCVRTHLCVTDSFMSHRN